METRDFADMKTEDSLAICLEYSEDKEAFKEVYNSTDIRYRMVGIDKYFEEDKSPRQIAIIEITRKGKTISFRFGISIHDTEAINYKWQFDDGIKIKMEKRRKAFYVNFCYSIFACIGCDLFIPDSFKEFCSESGYDEDSRKAEKTHRTCIEQRDKLLSVFTEKEAESFPS